MGTTSVPKVPTLVMNFSQSMDQQSVEASTLRITDLNNIGDQTDDVSFDIQIGAAMAASPPLATLNWTSADRVELTLNSLNSPLVAGKMYQLQMVVNKAKAAG